MRNFVLKKLFIKIFIIIYQECPAGVGGKGDNCLPPLFLVDQITLFGSGGWADFAHHINIAISTIQAFSLATSSEMEHHRASYYENAPLFCGEAFLPLALLAVAAAVFIKIFSI